MSPVLFDDYLDDENLRVLSENLGDYSWKGRLVGIASNGFLYVDKRVRKLGSYEFQPGLLPIEEVQQVAMSRHFALKSVLGGILLTLFGIYMVMMGWIGDEITGPVATWGPIVGVGGGLGLIFGAFRNKIAVQSVRGTFTWISPMLQYKPTLDTCRDVEAFCREARISCTSHVRDEV